MSSRLLEGVEGDETIFIARNGKPVAKLTAIKKKTVKDAVAAICGEHPFGLNGTSIREAIDDGRRY